MSSHHFLWKLLTFTYHYDITIPQKNKENWKQEPSKDSQLRESLTWEGVRMISAATEEGAVSVGLKLKRI